MKIKFKIKKSGFSIVEILLAVGVFAIFSSGIFYLTIDTMDRSSKTVVSTEALNYAREGLEAARNIRDTNYLNLTNGDHGLQLSDGAWSFVTAPEDIDGYYERTVTVSDVYRDESGNIASDGLYLDPETKRIDSEISWLQNGIIPKTIELSTYMSNWRGDDWIQTTCSEFENGTFENTENQTTDGPPTDNCGIELLEIEVESNVYISTDIGKHGNDVVKDGNYAYVASDSNTNGLFIVSVSDPENPSVVANHQVQSKGRYITKDGNYLYIGVQKNSGGLAIVNVTNPLSPSTIKQQNIGGYGNEAEANGNYLYVANNGSGSELKVYDISNKSNPIEIDSIELEESAHVIEISGNYAYVGTGEDDNGFVVYDISTPSNIQEVASLDVGEEVNAIVLNGSIAYIGTEENNDSLHVVDISDPTEPSLETSLNVGGEIEDLTISGSYLYAAIDEQNAGLAAINIGSPYSPTLAYNLDIQGKGAGIDSDTNYVYIATDTVNRGLVIIGTTVSGVNTSGTYTSEAFDTGSTDTIYNFIEWDHIEVPGSTVKFQIRTASSEAGLSSAVWVGSDGTNSTYYENPRTAIELDSGSSGPRYFQFKAFIDSNGASTPTIESVRINYTP